MSIKSVNYPIIMVLPAPDGSLVPTLNTDASVVDPNFTPQTPGPNYIAVADVDSPVIVNVTTGFSKQGNAEWVVSDLNPIDNILIDVVELDGIFYSLSEIGFITYSLGTNVWAELAPIEELLNSMIVGDGVIFLFTKNEASASYMIEIDSDGFEVNRKDETRAIAFKAFCYVPYIGYDHYLAAASLSGTPRVYALRMDTGGALIYGPFNASDTVYASIAYDALTGFICVVGSRVAAGCVYVNRSGNPMTSGYIDVTPADGAASVGFVKVVADAGRFILLRSDNTLWETRDFATYAQFALPASVVTVVDILLRGDKLYMMSADADGTSYMTVFDIGAEVVPGTTFPYQLLIDGEVFYTGRSTRQDIDVSHVLQDYFNSELVDLQVPGGASAIAAYYVANRRTGMVSVSDAPDLTQLAVNDYNIDYVPEYSGLVSTSDLIGGVMHPRQLLFLSGLNDGGSVHMMVALPGGEQATYAPTAVEYDAQGTYRLNIDTDTAQTITATLSDGAAEGVTLVNAYTIDPCAGDYALYFVNRRGGLSGVNMRGKGRRTSKAAEVKIKTNYDRLNRLARETRVIERTEDIAYALNSGWMSDIESAKMDDLFTSSKVWMHDLAEDKIYACHITDGQQDRKTFKNDRRVNYAVSVQISQTHLRR